MSSAKALARRTSTAVLAVLFMCAAALPILISSRASAAQMTRRQVEISTSRVSATDVNYILSFRAATSGNIQGIVVDFCNSPLINTTCATTVGNQPNTNFATLAIDSQTPMSGWTIDTTNSTATKIVITGANSMMTGGTTDVTIRFGSSGGSDGLTNPANNGTFYARIYTFTSAAAAQTGYTATANNWVDGGGIALSTANQLTVSARVQEVLQFCVGTDLANPGTAQCSDMSGTTVDLGVVGSGTANISPVATGSGGNNKNGLAMVRTNAVNGVVIKYFAEAVTGDSGSTHMGALRVSGSTCTGDGTFATGSKVDQCFNSAGTTQIQLNDEGFGMASQLNTANGTTTNLVRDGDYDGTSANDSALNGFAWSQTTPDTIATSNTVVDDEMLELRFAAMAAVTTPTGQYGVSSTFVATSSF